MADQPPTATAPQRRDYDDPYDTTVAPFAGGGVRVDVSSWGYWNVWLETESYVDWMGEAKAILQPGEAVSVAWRLVVGAAVSWWKRRLPDQVRGRLRSTRRVSR
jgi:hypothetical protein